MNAQTLNCHSCGAAVSTADPKCHHCGARLATISCPCCFSMMFREAAFCPQCGSAAARWEAGPSDRPCPACKVPMLQGTLNGIHLHECEKCFGIWLDPVTFEQVCRHAEQQAAVLGSARPVLGAGSLGPVRYLPCPQCRNLMNRLNFANCSGVIVDVCRAHGTWFDQNELHRIVQFIRAGGMSRSRARQVADLAAERRRLQAARSESGAGTVHGGVSSDPLTSADLFESVISAAGEILGTWLDSP